MLTIMKSAAASPGGDKDDTEETASSADTHCEHTIENFEKTDPGCHGDD